MRKFLAVLLLASILAGCAKPTSDLPSDVAQDAAVDSTDETAVTDPNLEAYPEKSEVTRLMHRANIEFEAGRFTETLAIVEKALQVDPTSVAATELKNRINDILIRT